MEEIHEQVRHFAGISGRLGTESILLLVFISLFNSGCSSHGRAADTIAPTVSITSPAANSTLSGTVTVMATATDDVAVASVQYKVDGTNTGPQLKAAPYSI
jgi:hypothetical protein